MRSFRDVVHKAYAAPSQCISAEEGVQRARLLANEIVAVTCPGSSAYKSLERWLFDSGSGHDLISVGDLSDQQLREVVPSAEMLQLQTANGDVSVDRCVDINIPSMPGVTALVLPQTPAVLSMGRKCLHEGYSFRWDAGQLRVLAAPDGTNVPLCVEGDVPYIDTAFLANTSVSAPAIHAEAIEVEPVIPAGAPSPQPEGPCSGCGGRR